MNEMSFLERQLHSWQPRHPCQALKRRLFAEPISLMPRMAWFVGWLVPATTCAVLTFSVFSSGNGLPGRSSERGPSAATLSSNRISLTPAPDSFQEGQNNVLSVTFDLTNRSGSTSGLPVLLRSQVN